MTHPGWQRIVEAATDESGILPRQSFAGQPAPFRNPNLSDDNFQRPGRIVVTCHRGLPPHLEQEIRELGFREAVAFLGGVSLQGTLDDCIGLNLNLRCASQVMYSLRQFRCNGPDDLYRGVRAIPWEEWLDPQGYFTVHGNVVHPSIRSGMFGNVKVKDAIVDRMRKETGARPDSGSEPRGAVVYLFWRNDRAEIFLDTSGETLAKHGYRRIPGPAPMVESLAAATLLAGRWDRRSPFVNPMCGSGTIAIEAALLATGRRPGLYREHYAFMHLLGYRAEVWQAERKRLERAIRVPEGLKIIASDLDPETLAAARINARLALVDELIEFQTCDFAATTIPALSGPGPEQPSEALPAGTQAFPATGPAVMFNPEYGERLGDELELAATYQRIGDFLKQECGGYFGYVFTGNPALSKKIGLRPKRRIEFATANLDCRLLEFELYAGSRRAKYNRPELPEPE